MGEKAELNKDYIVSSLRNQISNQAMMIAEREALIEQLGKEINDLKKEE